MFERHNKDTLVIVIAITRTRARSLVTRPTPRLLRHRADGHGEPIRASYRTGKTPPGQGHTGARVPVAAIGPQASNVLGVHDQTDLFIHPRRKEKWLVGVTPRPS